MLLLIGLPVAGSILPSEYIPPRPFRRGPHKTKNSSSGRSIGSVSNNAARATLTTAVLAPTPNPSESTATSENDGLATSRRMAWRMSVSSMWAVMVRAFDGRDGPGVVKWRTAPDMHNGQHVHG